MKPDATAAERRDAFLIRTFFNPEAMREAPGWLRLLAETKVRVFVMEAMDKVEAAEQGEETQ